MALDESTLVWAAALVEDLDPAEVLARADVAALGAIVADAAEATDPVDVAARLLVGVVQGRPFPRGNAAIAWLAAVDVLATAGFRVAVHRDRVVELCTAIRDHGRGPSGVAVALRRWVVPDGIECPACGRRVYASDGPTRRLLMPGVSRYELTARCAFEHGRHDRSGRAVAPAAAAAPPVDSRHPVLARGACGSFLVSGEGMSLVVHPFCDDPPVVRVVEVDDIAPGDLVGRWDRLVERSPTLGFAPADAARPDEDDHVDLERLRRALRGAPAASR